MTKEQRTAIEAALAVLEDLVSTWTDELPPDWNEASRYTQEDSKPRTFGKLADVLSQ